MPRPTDGTSSIDGGTIGARVSTGREGSGGGSGGSGGPACTYDEAAGLVDEVVKQIDGVWYVLYWRICGSTMTAVWIPELDGEDLAELAIDEVRRKLPAPATRLAPSPGAARDAAEHVDLDRSRHLAARHGDRRAPDAVGHRHRSPHGAPLRAGRRWARHGRHRLCRARASPGSPEYGDDRSSPCSYTYRHSSDLSATGTWTTSTTIEWAVTYQVSDGSSGDLGPLTTRSTLPVTVGELQAVLTGPG